VQDLRVAYPGRDGGTTEVVRGVSFTLGRERLGIVGESGSGKSQTGRAIMGLTAPGAVVSAKTLRFDGESGLGIDLLTCPPQQRRALRGGRMAMVMQDPKFPLSPVMRIGAQIEETLRTHLQVSSSVRRARMLQALADVGIDDPARVARLYPDEEADASSNPPNASARLRRSTMQAPVTASTTTGPLGAEASGSSPLRGCMGKGQFACSGRRSKVSPSCWTVPSSKSSIPPIRPSLESASRSATNISSQSGACGAGMTSELSRQTNSPRAAAIPTLLAGPKPKFSRGRSRRNGSPKRRCAA
jgi:hypothetical protein